MYFHPNNIYVLDAIESNPALLSGFFRRWVLGLYYVSQVFLGKSSFFNEQLYFSRMYF